jgi:hypothetical protein
MKYTLLLTTVSSLILSSCANIENVESKMSRYTPKAGGKNQVPEFEIGDVDFKNAKSKNRAPASMEASPKPLTGLSTEPAEFSGLSNKKLYFMSLYGQYEGLKIHATKYNAPEVNICPHFHTSLLEHKDKKVTNAAPPRQTKTFSYNKDQIKDANYSRQFPELYLPLSKEDIKPKVIDQLIANYDQLTNDKVNEFVHQAIDIHLSKTYTEIRELCEYGVSDNYYVYENLITHIKNNDFAAGKENLKTLLKTTLFSNTILMNSIEQKSVATQGRSLASVSSETSSKNFKKLDYTQEVINRLNVSWARDYFTKSHE